MWGKQAGRGALPKLAGRSGEPGAGADINCGWLGQSNGTQLNACPGPGSELQTLTEAAIAELHRLAHPAALPAPPGGYLRFEITDLKSASSNQQLQTINHQPTYDL
jgi:hypothetical protein